ncbi:hypothetical protein [Clostridium sporogenes]|uniref:hypothetical protein n=1 Tax=Clostridium sporogenes TaxID=1509 RepID=UPI000AC982B0|nr:hypothetical protein [Clostridium sporogenes]
MKEFLGQLAVEKVKLNPNFANMTSEQIFEEFNKIYCELIDLSKPKVTNESVEKFLNNY